MPQGAEIPCETSQSREISSNDNKDYEWKDISREIAAMNLAVTDQIREITKRLNHTNEELQRQVREKHDALLQQATHAGRFEAGLVVLAKDVDEIRTSAYNIKNQVDEQFQLFSQHSRFLERLYELSHLLRSSKTFLLLASKMKHTKDVLKQAELHYELNELMEDSTMSQIDFLQDSRLYIKNCRQRTRNVTQMQLVTGLQEHSESAVVHAIKIFQHFNTLDKCLENLNSTFISNLEQSLKECFSGNDITVLHKKDDSRSNLYPNKGAGGARGPGKAPQLTTTQNFRSKFWKSMHWLIYEELSEYCVQIQLLKVAFLKVRESGSTLPCNELTTNIDGESVRNQFWTSVQKLLKQYLSNSQGHIAQTLQEGLAKLMSSIRGFERRMKGEFLFDNDIFKHLENGYIGKCSANLKATLVGTEVPTNETIDNFIQAASNEMSSALVDKNLGEALGNVLIVCLKGLCSKLESQIYLGIESAQVVDVPNAQQLQNIYLLNVLYYLKDSFRHMLNDLGQQFIQVNTQSTAQANLLKSLDHIDLLIYGILQPIMDSIVATMKIIILTVHREPGLNTDKISVAGPSMYMKELQEFVNRVWQNHIVPFQDKEVVSKCSREVAKRCIDFFIHNLCIIRPLSIAGRERLKNDCLYLEQVLKPLCTSNIIELGKPPRLLRAIAFLLMKNPSELVKHNTESDNLVPSYLILLMLFGHAGHELQSPHSTVNWSNERFIEWLEGHTSDREKLELISGALQRYRDGIRRKKSDQYDLVYPLMMEFFETIAVDNTR